jgi:hypothetical protein
LTNQIPSLAFADAPAGNEIPTEGGWRPSHSADLTVHRVPEADAIRSAALDAFGVFDDAESSAMAAALAGEVTSSRDAARCEVLEAARRLLQAHRRQHETRLAANEAETAWTVASFSSGFSREEVRRANRARRESLRAHEAAWHAYQTAAQQLCRATEWMVELETLEEGMRG